MKASNKVITVLTPTYNRADLLSVAYKSLIIQNNMNFVWMIIDDGSFDNTEEVVRGFQKENKIEILYYKKENGGKHTALNFGIERINTELTIILDSDDRLLPNAIDSIVYFREKYTRNENNICGYTFLRCHSDGKPIVGLDKDEFVANYVDYRIKHNRPGDMAEVFYTNILKEFPFPIFENEKFISEDVVWIQIGLKYNVVYINKAIYLCDYLEGGLTDTDKRVKFKSPLGSMFRGKMLMRKECGFKVNIKGAIIYNCYKNLAKKSVPNNLKLKSIRENLLVISTKILGYIYYRKWGKTID